MLKTLARSFVSAALPANRPSCNPASFPIVRRRLRAPSSRLVKYYASWCGAPEHRYATTLPPHMVAQFAPPVWAVQLARTRYPLVKIINQGCGIRIHQDIPLGAALDVAATVVGLTENDQRARIHQQLAVGTQAEGRALTVDFYATFILGRKTAKKNPIRESVALSPVAAWDAHQNDGFRYGVLTGDLNPVHWIDWIAKRTPFNGKVMHGFGMLARCFEILQNVTEETIRSIDVRFVRPVRLPSRGLRILHSAPTGNRGDRVVALEDRRGIVLMAGRYNAS